MYDLLWLSLLIVWCDIVCGTIQALFNMIVKHGKWGNHIHLLDLWFIKGPMKRRLFNYFSYHYESPNHRGKDSNVALKWTWNIFLIDIGLNTTFLRCTYLVFEMSDYCYFHSLSNFCGTTRFPKICIHFRTQQVEFQSKHNFTFYCFRHEFFSVVSSLCFYFINTTIWNNPNVMLKHCIINLFLT